MRFFKLFLIICLIGIFFSCEKEIEIDPPGKENSVVVDGRIEVALSPIVILTRSQPFFSEINIQEYERQFVRGAQVTIAHNGTTDTLQEYSLSDLPMDIKQQVSSLYGYNLFLFDSFDIPFFLYTDTTLKGQEGTKYDLEIISSGEKVTASTTMPNYNPVDSFYFTPHPNQEEFSDWYSINVRYSDPPVVKNYIRYFTSINGAPFYPGIFGSVYDDESLFNVDGESFNLPLQRGYPLDFNLDINETDTSLYFQRGDTITLRWSAIDLATYNFWTSVEFDKASAGNPFSAPIRIRSNVNGALGLWGSYASSYYTKVVP